MKTSGKTTYPKKIIGVEAVHVGNSLSLDGYGSKVLVTGVFRYDEPEDSPDRFLTCNKRLQSLGGLRATDGLEVHVWLSRYGRFSFVGEEVSDASLIDFSAIKTV